MISDIHPQLRSLAKQIPELKLNWLTVKLLRQAVKLLPREKIPHNVDLFNLKIERFDSPKKLHLRVYKPKHNEGNVPAMIWMHGGGLVIGNPVLNDATLFQFVQQLGIVIVSVDYRLAPENPYPAALYDCYSALKWMAENARELSIDKHRICVGGESAGGGLAASLAQYSLDKGEISPIFQFLIYPMLDDRTAVDEKYTNKKYYGWNQKNNYFGWKSYLNLEPGSISIPQYAVANRRENLSGLPPAWIFCGKLDMFYDENLQYAQRLREFGTQCEFESIEGVYHGFDSINFHNEFITSFRMKQIDVLRKYLF